MLSTLNFNQSRLSALCQHRWLGSTCLLLALAMFVGCEEAGDDANAGTSSQSAEENAAVTDDQHAKQTASNESANQEAKNQDAADESEVEITLISADQHKLAEIIEQQQGKVVLVDFWATWCGPCVQKFPHIIEMHKKLGEQGLVVITVSLDQPDADVPVMDFLKKQQAGSINLLASMDMSTSADDFELSAGVPEYRVYDRQGKLDTVFKTDPTAQKPYTAEDIEAKVKELLAKDAG